MALLSLGVVLGVAWLIWNRVGLDGLKKAGPLPFFATLSILPAFGVPITPLYLLAGAMFGAAVGLGGVWVALGLNLALCYWIARRGLRRWISRLLKRLPYQLPEFGRADRGPWRALRFTLAVKATPGVPAFLKNYGLGVAAVPFPIYLGASMVITGTYAALLVLLGESLLEHRVVRLGMVVAAVVAVGVGLVWRKKRPPQRT